tara:strand:+ start:337 stop:654 length:318 start_codon:yes stop_codon:yes gene_type:complete
MFPASFASMILKLIMPKIMDQFMEIFKLDKVLKYVEQPNELDVEMENVNKKCIDIGIKVQAMEEVLKGLDDDSHPPVIDIKEWEDVKETIKKIKNKSVFKSLNAK